MSCKSSRNAGCRKAAWWKYCLSREEIRDCADDRPLPGALFLGDDAGHPLHVVAAIDVLRRPRRFLQLELDCRMA